MRSNGAWLRLSSTVDRRWPVACLTMAVLLLLRVVPCVAQVTTVQIPENTPPDSPIQLGPFYVTPTFELREIGIDTNVFNDDDVKERDFTATPSAVATGVTLFGPMRFTGLLNTEYVWFQKFRSERSFNSTSTLRFEGFFDRLRPWVVWGCAGCRPSAKSPTSAATR